MFTRRQAIRWAELWLSCWNDGDLDTLLALHRDDVRFEGEAGSSRADRREALKRHWAAVPCGIHSAPVELDQVIWDPDSRQLAIVYFASLDGTRVRGCDLVRLDADGHVVAGGPCVGSILEDEPDAAQLSPAYQLVGQAGGR